MFHYTKLLGVIGLFTQWALLFWLNQRLDLDPFVQLILLPLLLLSGLLLMVFRYEDACD